MIEVIKGKEVQYSGQSEQEQNNKNNQDPNRIVTFERALNNTVA